MDPIETIETDLLWLWPLRETGGREEEELAAAAAAAGGVVKGAGDHGIDPARAREVAAADGTVSERVER